MLEYVKHVYSLPENRNVIIDNDNCKIHKEGKWIDKDKNNTLDKILYKNNTRLFRHYNNHKNDGDIDFNVNNEFYDKYFYDTYHNRNNIRYYNLRRDSFFIFKNKEYHLDLLT